MAFGTIHETFWTSKTLKGISTPARLLAAYLLTGPHRNAIGCYRLPVSYIVEDLGWDADTVSDTLSELEERAFIQRDADSALTLLPKFFEYNPIISSKVGIMCARLADSLPKDSPVFGHLIDAFKTIADKLPPGWLEKQSYPIGYPIQPPEQRIPLNLTQPINNQTNPNTASVAPKRSRKRGSYSEEFEKFWKAYPACEGNPKAPAWQEWLRATDGTEPDEIIAAVGRYAASLKAPDAPKACHARTWLYQRRWEVWGEKAAAPAVDPVSRAEQERPKHEEFLIKLSRGFTWPQWLGPAPGEKGNRTPARYRDWETS